MKHLLSAGLFFVHAALVNAAPVDVNVIKTGGVYTFTLEFVAQAPAQRVFELLTDYSSISRLNALIKSSRILPSENPRVTRVETVTRGCIMFFCKTIRCVEDVTVAEDLTITSDFVAALSDFKAGRTQWTLTPWGTGTLVNYQLSMAPDFWLPPFIGPSYLQKKLRKQLRDSADKINLLLTENE